MEEFLIYAFVGGGSFIAMHYFAYRQSKELTKSISGIYLLRVNKFYYYLGLITVLIGLIATVGILVDFSEITALTILGLVLIHGLGMLLILFYKNHKVSFNEKFVSTENWRKKEESILWNEIEEVAFNGVSGYLVIKSTDKKIKIHKDVIGLEKLLSVLEQKTGKTVII